MRGGAAGIGDLPLQETPGSSSLRDARVHSKGLKLQPLSGTECPAVQAGRISAQGSYWLGTPEKKQSRQRRGVGNLLVLPRTFSCFF